MRKLLNIIEGWWLYLKSDECTNNMSNDRQAICKDCPNRTSINTCDKCGCFLPAKTRVRDEYCPALKWTQNFKPC